MKVAPFLFAICLGCTTVVEAPVKPPRPKIDADKSVSIVMACDHLGFARGGETHRLCVLRGIDRYVDHQSVPLSERYQRVPECAQYPCVAR